MMVSWLRTWSAIEKVVGSNLTFGIHHYKKQSTINVNPKNKIKFPKFLRLKVVMFRIHL
jgi:hypothetical protein